VRSTPSFHNIHSLCHMLTHRTCLTWFSLLFIYIHLPEFPFPFLSSIFSFFHLPTSLYHHHLSAVAISVGLGFGIRLSIYPSVHETRLSLRPTPARVFFPPNRPRFPRLDTSAAADQ
jgi:hypothetical protein